MISRASVIECQSLDLVKTSVSAATPESVEDQVSNSQVRLAWDRAQRQYWDGVADKYDCLYQGRWSHMEDAWVALQLSFIADLTRPSIVDLGCGTGLGWRLIKPINPYAEYRGIDISPSMAQMAANSGINVTVGSMDDLSFLADSSIDVVIALSSSLSFAFEPARVISEVSRVLRPSGHAYLSALSRKALSRLCRSINSPAQYWTRGDICRGSGAPAHLFNIDEIKRLGYMTGLVALSAKGINALSGVCEVPFIWSLGRLATSINRNFAHLLDLHFQKVGGTE